MEEQDITGLLGELAEYTRLLDASVEDRNPQLLGTVAARLREAVSPVYEALDKGPKAWRNAIGGAWIAMNSADSVQEQLSLPELDWGRIGAAVSFAESGVEQLRTNWNQMLERNV